MAWNIKVTNVEKIEDPNPDVWLKSAEENLRKGDFVQALSSIDKAISYSNNNLHYILQKIRVLYSCSKFQNCIDLVGQIWAT